MGRCHVATRHVHLWSPGPCSTTQALDPFHLPRTKPNTWCPRVPYFPCDLQTQHPACPWTATDHVPTRGIQKHATSQNVCLANGAIQQSSGMVTTTVAFAEHVVLTCTFHLVLIAMDCILGMPWLGGTSPAFDWPTHQVLWEHQGSVF